MRKKKIDIYIYICIRAVSSETKSFSLLQMKLSTKVLLSVFATIAGVSAIELDLGFVGKSLDDIPAEKRADALFDHLETWEMRRSLLPQQDVAMKKRGGSGESSIDDSLGDVVVNVKIGSEKNKVPMLLDTGSPSTLVKDSFFNPNKSSTSSDPLALFMVGYASGQSAKGPVVTDDFYFGDLKAESFPIGILTKKYYSILMNDKIGGLLALMIPGRAENQWYNGQPKEVDLITHLKNQGAIDNRKWQVSVGKDGKLIIGGHDESLAEGGFKEVRNSGMAETHVGINGKLNDGPRVIFLFDTGTNGIITTTDNAKQIYKDLGADVKEVDGGNVVGMVDCKNPPTLKFSATDDDLEVEIPKEEITSKDDGSGKCVLPIHGVGLVGTNGSLRHLRNSFIVGQAYLRHITFATDFDSPATVKVGKQRSN